MTEKQLSKTIERKLKGIYHTANKQVQKKALAALNEFEAQNKGMSALLTSNAISVEDYNNWRKRAILDSQFYSGLQKQIATEYLNAQQTAQAYVNGKLPDAYALGFNKGVKEVNQVAGVSFNLVNQNTVKRLVTENKLRLPTKQVNVPKAERWITKKINRELTQGIIQGESNDKIAARLRTVTNMTESQSIRSARTMTTSCENQGTLDEYIEAKEMGIDLVKIWLATSDELTREEHAEIDGEEAEVDEPFSNGLMYPADPSGDPEQVYNCRCTMITRLRGFK